MRTAAVPNESCHFWSIRSRITWQLIGGGIFAAFAALGIEALVNEARNHQSEAPALVSVSVCMVIAVFIFANAFRTGHLWLTRDRLTYQAVFRSNHFSRQEISGARIEVRTRFPSPRKLNMPVLVTSDGRQLPLPELCTPFDASIPVLNGVVQLDGTPEKYMESLDGLAAWIQAWIESPDWVAEADNQAEV